MVEAPLIRMRGITKRFPGVTALNNVDFDLAQGEIHALVGENGSGKSTLCKCLYGFLVPDEGTVEIDGSVVTIDNAHRALQLGIVAITQELTLALSLTATENILMGRMPRAGSVSTGKRRVARAREALDQTERRSTRTPSSARSPLSCSRRSRSLGQSPPAPECSSWTRLPARYPKPRQSVSSRS